MSALIQALKNLPTTFTGFLAGAGKAVYSGNLGLKEMRPWKLTGSWTEPDYMHYLPSGLEYRKISPGSNPIKAIVPHTPPSLVYDIKYFVRDDRRKTFYTARTVDATPFDFSKMFGKAPLKPEQLVEIPTPPMMPTRGY
mmetsp:Transcript_16357/g.28044  ORF Transcript_16357/g.28044 Transcript_16357/m.28044 type:complete len:139 (-) Transcript_16357:314-730(-)|eukprot:CAMPEP_0119106586 /NCGR_PEP_ID=MMETSP1180-20130426/5043_1 /TAXON_ID=3052 ORGANISM="Chlamydomonas cf sp, Strain CCMP681" /NCGR_SAMPLE_ID=MMETSP1180 /ASSEMBLY_ACC=CAM_ASM_000741 /LENGTH=138 /DNA_ID=CAMNT_0007091949 /DNA_START=37 /DNA_END=453 /DNA_ORIENTATION=-